MQKITPFLWFNFHAEEAVNFYAGIFPDASIGRILRYGKTGPGPEGSVMTIDFSLAGQQYTALNGGPNYSFSPAISLVVNCTTQAEVDHYWDRLGDGGSYVQCGWLTDRFGLSWQVVPEQLLQLMSSPDSAQNERVMQAMMKMVKLDIATLQRAARG